MAFMTREVWDALIIGIIAVGLILAFIRLRADLTRPMDDHIDDTEGD